MTTTAVLSLLAALLISLCQSNPALGQEPLQRYLGCMVQPRMGANYDGAYVRLEADTEQDCIRKCIDKYSECVAVDFNLEMHVCAGHRPQTGVGRWQANTCCNRYEIISCNGTVPPYTEGPGQITSPRSPATGAAYTRPDFQTQATGPNGEPGVLTTDYPGHVTRDGPDTDPDHRNRTTDCPAVPGLHDYPRGWVYLRPTQKYYRAIFELMDWKKAERRCRDLGMYSRLVDINDHRENMAVKRFIASFEERLQHICEGPRVFGLRGYQGYWTSGQRRNSSSCASPWVWKTYSGSFEDVTYTDWHDDEPDCAEGHETCLQLTTTNYLDQHWADIDCDWVLCPLCELDL